MHHAAYASKSAAVVRMVHEAYPEAISKPHYSGFKFTSVIKIYVRLGYTYLSNTYSIYYVFNNCICMKF